MSTIKPKPFQPSDALQRLAASVNARLPDSGMVNFFGLAWPDGRIQTGIIFSCGVNRSTRIVDEAPDEEDADKIVGQINGWMGGLQPASNWTDDPSEAAPGSH